MERLLAVSGSLRAGSSNSTLLEAAGLLLPFGVRMTQFTGVRALPPFSPDDDSDAAPESVAAWRAALIHAQAVVLSSPEYAHGMPGALKNALDWVVGSGELYGKRVALLNPSPESLFAHAQLAEVLRTMGAEIVEAASITVRIPRRGVTAADLIQDAAIASQVRDAMRLLIE